MNKLLYFSELAIASLAAVLLASCSSGPDLTQESARTLIQASYDQRPPAPVVILVDRIGLKQGYDAHYWKLAKVYPNNRWADYNITPEGKQVLTLNGGGEMIQWRPDQDGFGHFFISTVATSHPRARDVQPLENDVIANVSTAKSARYVEIIDLTGVPQPLQDMAHNPGNTLSTHRQAEFALENGVWKVFAIR